MKSPTIQVVSKTQPLPDALRTALERASAFITINTYEDMLRADAGGDYDALVLVVPEDQQAVQSHVEQIFSSLADKPCGTLVVTKGPINGIGTTRRPPGVPVSFAVDPTADELSAQLATICAFVEPFRHMAERTRQMAQRSREMASEASQLDEQLRLASQVQRDFLPRRLPECDSVRFLTLYRPAEYVSGDIYDVTRLDETHIGIAVADVTGHGVPAALLTLFVKRAWRGKEINGNLYRIVPPDELLYRLNRELLDADLEQCQFVTACCAIYHAGRRTLTWARGGLPYPILVRPGQPPQQIRSAGELIGAFEGARFELCHRKLEPGDTMLFFSDGLEALLLGDSRGSPDLIEQTDWFQGLGKGPIEDDIDTIRSKLNHVGHREWPRDDVTIVGISVEN